MSNKTIDNFLFVDKGRIKMYLDQFAQSEVKKAKRKHSISLSFRGPKYDLSVEKEVKDLNTFEQIKLLENLLNRNGLLYSQRPKDIKINEILTKVKFVHEVIPVTKVVFLKDKISRVHNADMLTVWISDPPEEDISKENWLFTGAFLYLIESPMSDYGSYSSHCSGKSALSILYRLITGKEFFVSPSNKKNEPLGRSSYKHPLRKLKEIGAIEVGVEFIEVLYYCRYISDEQCFDYNGKPKRVCDLLGYPIYIKQV